MLREGWKTDALWALLWMSRGLEVLALLWMLLMFLGCSAIHDEGHPPTVRTMLVSTSVAETYAKAQHTAVQMRAPLLHEDAEHHRFTVQSSTAVALSIAVEAVPEGTRLTVAGQVIPRAILIGIITDVDDFLFAYRRG